jgi:hypothetical protein
MNIASIEADVCSLRIRFRQSGGIRERAISVELPELTFAPFCTQLGPLIKTWTQSGNYWTKRIPERE